MATATLTTKQVMALAGVSHVTVYLWRQGTPTKEALPTVDGSQGRAVVFKPTTFRAWAKKHGVELKCDPVALAEGSVKLPNRKTFTKEKKAAKVAKKTAASKVTKATTKRTKH